MSESTTRTLITAAEAATTPLPPGRLSALLLAHGSMQLRWYAPKGEDAQTPHDALFVRAGEPHRFEDFSPDFATWVVFYGAKGGEKSLS